MSNEIDIEGWTEVCPYDPEQINKILMCLGFDEQASVERQMFLDHIIQEASTYARRSYLDKDGENNIKKEHRLSKEEKEKILKHEREKWPKAGEVNKKLKGIQKNISTLSKLIDDFDLMPYSHALYLSHQQSEAFHSLVQAARVIEKNPLPEPKGKTGAIQYPALYRFVNELMFVYEQKTGKKATISTNSTSNKNSDFNYDYIGPFFRFLCACVLPLSASHSNPDELGNYASNLD